jgi:hypothetical protein
MYFEIEGPVFETSIFTFTGWLWANETIERTSKENNSTADSEFLLLKDITNFLGRCLFVERAAGPPPTATHMDTSENVYCQI